MRIMRWMGGSLALLALCACGGGGGSSGGSSAPITLSQSSMTFTATQGASVPAAMTLHVTFVGDGVVAGYAPGVVQPSWLSVTALSGTTSSTADFSIAVTDTATSGTRTTSVRFVTGTVSGNNINYADLAVTYTVNQPFNVTSSSGNIAFTSIAKGQLQPAAGYTLTVTGAQSHWHVSSAQSWLKFSPASGTGAGQISVTADASSQGHGNFNDQIIVADDTSGTQKSFAATLSNRAAILTVMPTSVAFNVDSTTPPSQLAQMITVTDELGGTVQSEAVSWSLQSSSGAWLQWAPGSGSSVPAAVATLGLSTSQLATLQPGTYTGSVTLKYTNADVSNQTIVIPVTLNFSPGLVRYVAPYIGIANRAGTLIVRGKGFGTAGAAVTVTVGGTALAPLVPDSDTQLRINYPALAAGRYAVGVQNAGGFTTQTADLVVITPPVVSYTAISAPTTRMRIVWDAERQTLYGVNRTDQEIESYMLNAGNWTAGSPYVLPQLTDLDLMADGKSLVVLTKGSVDQVALGQGAFTAVPRTPIADTFCGRFFDRVAAVNEGKAYIVVNNAQCSGYTFHYLWNAADYSITSSGNQYNAIAVASADGSKVITGSDGLSPAQPVVTFNALDDTVTVSQNVTYNLAAITVSGNASRVVLQNTDVYSGSLAILGNLPIVTGGISGVSLASRDSTRVFVYREIGSAPVTHVIEVYDLTLPLLAGAMFQKTSTITLADSPNTTDGQYGAITLTGTPGDSAIFVSGNSKILVVPIP